MAEAPAAAGEQQPESPAEGNGAAAPLGPPQRPDTAGGLPDELQNVTAVLSAPNPAAPGGRTLVYVLGMSHVSRRSIMHVEQLIRLVRGPLGWRSLHLPPRQARTS